MIEIKNLQKIIGQQIALDIEILRVVQGEIAAVVGSAGSGIEALFDLLIGRSHPSSGTVRLDAIDPKDGVAFSRAVGVMFYEDGLYQRQSPLGNYLLICRFYGLPNFRAFEVLAQIGMADQANTRLSNLSSGMLRRLAFGRAILHEPPVLLLYEPFIRCDETAIALLGGLMQQLAADGAAILIMADDAAHLSTLCETIYELRNGRLSEGHYRGEAKNESFGFKIPVRIDEKVILLDPVSILFAEAESGRARLQTIDRSLHTQFTLSELEERLSRSGFFRAHRSYLVNLQHVKEVIPYTRNSFTLRLDDQPGTEIPLSKSAAAELRDLLGY